MASIDPQLKKILRQIAHNLATLSATVDALESAARSQGWDAKELLQLHEQAKGKLEIVFLPLLRSIEGLDEEEEPQLVH